MLHFAAPDKFAIWDSKVAAACNYTFHGNRRRNAVAYLEYVKQLRAVVDPTTFDKTYDEVKAEINLLGIKTNKPFLTRLRVGELLLFSSELNLPNS